jgi:hypothetical protein
MPIAGRALARLQASGEWLRDQAVRLAARSPIPESIERTNVSAEIKPTATAADPGAPSLEREPDAIYQNNKIVARVVEPEIRTDAKEVHFGEISDSEYLILPEECEFQKYRLLIQRIAYASRIDKQRPDKGRILRGVVAEILGYREQ